jgi:hypothetical protein
MSMPRRVKGALNPGANARARRAILSLLKGRRP